MPPKKGKTYARPMKKEIELAEKELKEFAKDDVLPEDMADDGEERYARYPDTEKD